MKSSNRVAKACKKDYPEALIHTEGKGDMAAAAAAPATSNGNTPALGTAPAAAAPAGGSGGVGGGSGAQFREIHKNTWLKRLTADGKRLTVGPKVRAQKINKKKCKY